MNELQTILADSVSRLFTDRVTQDLRESAERGHWPAALWTAVEEAGLTLPQIPEARGGGGGSWEDAYVVVSAAGRFAVPLPLPETMVAAWLLSQAGLDVPLGPLTIASGSADRLHLARDGSTWRVDGVAPRVPWGRAAGHVVVAADGGIALVASGSARIEPDVNLALEPRDTLTWSRAPALAAAPGST
jgi:acyl-CoA dehydrogenase